VSLWSGSCFCRHLMTTATQLLDDSLSGDAALAESARLGSAPAFAELITKHRDAVYIIVRNLCRSDDAAQEILQNAFIAAWRDFASFPPGARFSTWLYRIATKTALAHRASERRSTMPCPLDTFLPVFDAAGRLVAGDARWRDVEGRHPERKEATDALREMLECIDDGARAAFVLCDVTGLHPEEAAVILETSPRDVRGDAHRARLLLRGFIDRLSAPDDHRSQ
jgi:RNA polymerase sigma-70 factor, ECF subfamily